MFVCVSEMKSVVLVLLVLAVLVVCQGSRFSGKLYIGFIYCNNGDLAKAQYYVEQLNNDVSLSPKSRLKLELKSLKLSESDNPISISLAICNNLMPNGSIYAIVVSNTSCLPTRSSASYSYKDNDPLSTLSAISSTSAYYQIPVIDLYHRDALFSDKVCAGFDDSVSGKFEN